MDAIEALLLLSKARYGDDCQILDVTNSATRISYVTHVYRCQRDGVGVMTGFIVSCYVSRDDLMALHKLVASNNGFIILLANNDTRHHTLSLPSAVSGNVIHISSIRKLHRIATLSPQHRKATEGEIKDLTNACIDSNTLPRISPDDPMAIWYGFKCNDVVVCSSTDGNHYRVVG